VPAPLSGFLAFQEAAEAAVKIYFRAGGSTVSAIPLGRAAAGHFGDDDKGRLESSSITTLRVLHFPESDVKNGKSIGAAVVHAAPEYSMSKEYKDKANRSDGSKAIPFTALLLHQTPSDREVCAD